MLTDEEIKEMQEMFKDTQLPDPEHYPKSFMYCLKLYKHFKQLQEKQ
jgi:hypothetical protein|tara:strand:+ start:527 stop:667 length:141 start_codon:yes stop_codon:yes gene_type:complete